MVADADQQQARRLQHLDPIPMPCHSGSITVRWARCAREVAHAVRFPACGIVAMKPQGTVTFEPVAMPAQPRAWLSSDQETGGKAVMHASSAHH